MIASRIAHQRLVEGRPELRIGRRDLRTPTESPVSAPIVGPTVSPGADVADEPFPGTLRQGEPDRGPMWHPNPCRWGKGEPTQSRAQMRAGIEIGPGVSPYAAQYVHRGISVNRDRPRLGIGYKRRRL